MNSYDQTMYSYIYEFIVRWIHTEQKWIPDAVLWIYIHHELSEECRVHWVYRALPIEAAHATDRPGNLHADEHC